MEIIEFLVKYRRFLNISSIEVECGIPDGFLRKVLTSDKRLPDKHIIALSRFFDGFVGDLKVDGKARSKFPDLPKYEIPKNVKELI